MCGLEMCGIKSFAIRWSEATALDKWLRFTQTDALMSVSLQSVYLFSLVFRERTQKKRPKALCLGRYGGWEEVGIP